jgi:hypothetical protein
MLVPHCPLPSLNNLNYNASEATPGDVIQVSCEPGTVLSGPSSITCKENEQFDATIFPSCTGMSFIHICLNLFAK